MESELIGGYKVLRQIGAGGMAKVYLAVHKDVPNLKVILKVLTDSRLVERFRQEADKLAMLDGNPNICRIKHFFNHGEAIVIAMEYIDGQTLDQIIKDRGRMTPQEALPIMQRVMEVLEFAHGKGIYHRDIKPSNIMLDSQGNVKVIDFGIAKGKTDPHLTISGTACGTPPYMAPEQFTPRDDTDYALVDVYAVGVTLYLMMGGELPFKGDNEFSIRDAKLFTDPKPLSDLEKSIPKEISRMVMKSIAREPADRFSSMQEFSKALTGFVSTSSQPTISISTGKPESGHRKSRLPLIAGIAAIVVIAIAAVFYWTGRKPKPAPPSPPDLVSPIDGTEVAGDNVHLVWNRSEIGGGSYSVEYATTTDFTDAESFNGLSDTLLDIAGTLPPGLYYWRVESAGKDGLTSGFSATQTFSVAARVTDKGTLQITVDPYGDIYVDNALVTRGGSDYRTSLDTGSHHVEVRNESARPKTKSETVDISSDSATVLNFAFHIPEHRNTNQTNVTPVAAGELRVGSRPVNGAAVYIDGKLMERPTPASFSLSPGQHIVRGTLTVDGVKKEKTDTVQVVSDSTTLHFLEFE